MLPPLKLTWINDRARGTQIRGTNYKNKKSQKIKKIKDWLKWCLVLKAGSQTLPTEPVEEMKLSVLLTEVKENITSQRFAASQRGEGTIKFY